MRQAGAAYSLGVARGPQFAASWSGDYLLSAIAGMGRREGDDLVMQRVAGGPPERVPIDTDANESDGRLSPDGQWIAYTSDQSGREEVWVASFPSGKLRRQVSSDGGTEPQWCDQRELVYLAADRHFTVVPFRGSADGIELGDHAPLFRRSDVIRWERTLAPTVNNYAATADCGRFLVRWTAQCAGAPHPRRGQLARAARAMSTTRGAGAAALGGRRHAAPPGGMMRSVRRGTNSDQLWPYQAACRRAGPRACRPYQTMRMTPLRSPRRMRPSGRNWNAGAVRPARERRDRERGRA